ncbi:uncharacterized protein N7473_006411 [Penicillium subrubescens]|uniref:uncharacterized protein n=1 Tax=Penicillium subrubescens TaxID=1316194 RepID=UPI002545478A|nr:uncharacterized protein N7473_006411 [Penicillium subrubescens]KAJ5897012.1 hypothetical protein N7473_006411 [Penicillium subrubescens]
MTVTSLGWGPPGFMHFQRPLDGCEGETVELLPGQTPRRNIGHLEPFWDHMAAGERYELLWQGSEYALRAWGNLRENWFKKLGLSRGYFSFTCIEVEERSDSDSQPDDPRVEKSDRILGTPCIKCVSGRPIDNFPKGKGSYHSEDTYEGLTNRDHEASCADAKPIVIHDYPFASDNFRLRRRCHEQWMT